MMAHWAEIDETDTVVRVVVGSNDDIDEGYQWLTDNLGGTWIKCSYNTRGGSHHQGGQPLRFNYPAPGYTFSRDPRWGPDGAFIPPQPFPSWVLSNSTGLWVAPVPMPTTGDWYWHEDTLSWVEVTA